MEIKKRSSYDSYSKTNQRKNLKHYTTNANSHIYKSIQNNCKQISTAISNQIINHMFVSINSQIQKIERNKFINNVQRNISNFINTIQTLCKTDFDAHHTICNQQQQPQRNFEDRQYSNNDKDIIKISKTTQQKSNPIKTQKTFKFIQIVSTKKIQNKNHRNSLELIPLYDKKEKLLMSEFANDQTYIWKKKVNPDMKKNNFIKSFKTLKMIKQYIEQKKSHQFAFDYNCKPIIPNLNPVSKKTQQFIKTQYKITKQNLPKLMKKMSVTKSVPKFHSQHRSSIDQQQLLLCQFNRLSNNLTNYEQGPIKTLEKGVKITKMNDKIIR